MLPELSYSRHFFRFSWHRLFLIKPRPNQKINHPRYTDHTHPLHPALALFAIINAPPPVSEEVSTFAPELVAPELVVQREVVEHIFQTCAAGRSEVLPVPRSDDDVHSVRRPQGTCALSQGVSPGLGTPFGTCAHRHMRPQVHAPANMRPQPTCARSQGVSAGRGTPLPTGSLS